MCVEQGSVPSLFTAVNVHPTLAVYTVDFGPDVVLGVPDPSHSAADCTAEHGEAVSPLANAATSGLEQNEGIVVSREALV